MANHPYESMPSYRRWSRAVASLPPADLDPVVDFPFKITRQDKVATAGSCFAQHIAKRLAQSGYNYFVAEKGHPLASEEVRRHFQYELFSARYGNIYTARQLLQLFREAFGRQEHRELYWQLGSRYVDPLRPAVEPDGFASVQELLLERGQHLAAVRRMFSELDVLVFTLGLTEAWESTEDGTIYPLCPGVRGGCFDENIHVFRNFGVSEVADDLTEFMTELLSVNARAKVILTVSPVPLVATALDRHVLVSTTYSKSVLRVAAEMVQNRFPGIMCYFPSYEIITGAHGRGSYFEADLRSVTAEGVDHVMRTFFRHVAADSDGMPAAQEMVSGTGAESFTDRMEAITRVICEEELLDKMRPR